MQFYFSDRINQSSLKRFAPADRMDRRQDIAILKQKYPDNPVNPV
jgi:hypothetical protein